MSSKDASSKAKVKKDAGKGCRDGVGFLALGWKPDKVRGLKFEKIWSSARTVSGDWSCQDMWRRILASRRDGDGTAPISDGESVKVERRECGRNREISREW